MRRLEECPVRPGDLLAEKYRVERVLGVGGMGAVVAARHLVLDEIRAVKLLLPRTERRPEAVERFVREARAAVRLRSEHVVRVHDVGTLATGAPYMVMDYLEGRTLKGILDSGQVPVAQAVDYVLQALEAVAEAHGVGLVHRDLKPSNLFVTIDADERPSVKVLDFGISKLMWATEVSGDMTGTGDLLGSPFYMSPEQMRSTRNVDERADIWSIGVILYELLGGDVPFRGETITALCLAVVQDEPVPPSHLREGVPPGLEAVVMRCLEKSVETRYQNVADLAVDLAPFAPPYRQISVQRIGRSLGRSPAARVRDGMRRVSAYDDEATAIAPLPTRPAAPPEAGEAVPPADPAPAHVGAALGADSGSRSNADTSATRVVAEPPATAAGATSASVSTAASDTGSAPGWQQSNWSGVPPFGKVRRGLGPKAAVAIGAALAVAVTGVGLVVFFASRPDDAGTSTPTPALGSAEAAAAGARSDARSEPARGVETPSVPDGMVVVPAGEYWVGCDDSHAERCFDDEKPGYEVRVAAFGLMRREVTIAQYSECTNARACPATSKDDCTAATGNPELPVTCVTWAAAAAYCNHRGWRLPTEIDWEVAARGADRRSFPWGNDKPSCVRSVVAGEKRGGCDSGGPLAPGSRPTDVSWVGALDLGGNVREWTATDYQAYPGGSVEPGATGKVNRGASWMMHPSRANTSHTRGADDESEARPDLGFRCAADL